MELADESPETIYPCFILNFEYCTLNLSNPKDS